MEQLEAFAQKRLALLKKRANRCVCKYCGGSLRLRRIIFSDYEEARVEIFCEHCDRIEYGCEPEIYRNALYFVEEMQFTCYPDLEANERTKRMNVAKVCEIMMWGDTNLGFLSEEGFTVPPQSQEMLIGECVVLTDADLD